MCWRGCSWRDSCRVYSHATSASDQRQVCFMVLLLLWLHSKVVFLWSSPHEEICWKWHNFTVMCSCVYVWLISWALHDLICMWTLVLWIFSRSFLSFLWRQPQHFKLCMEIAGKSCSRWGSYEVLFQFDGSDICLGWRKIWIANAFLCCWLTRWRKCKLILCTWRFSPSK